MPVFRKVDRRYWKARRKPWSVRLLIRMPWLLRLQWWHVGLSVALVVVPALAWLSLRPVADSRTRVVARIDGSAITEADLIAEAGGPVAVDQRDRLLDAVIERRLLAAAAGKDPMARSPEALATAQRARETMLASLIAQRIVGEVNADDAAARRYIAAHPATFGQRQMVLVDAGPIDQAVASGPVLRQAETLSQAKAALRPTGVTFVHTRRVIDTATVPPELGTQIMKVPPGRLFLWPMGRQAMLGAVIERTPLVMSPAIQLEQARAGAIAEIRQARLSAALKAMRANADIKTGG
jgi:hypothetical protein